MQPMTLDEMQAFVGHAWLGHIGLAKGGRAYVIPIFYAYDQGVFYFHSLHGAKEEYLEATREACLNIVHAESADRWASVLAFGPAERVTHVGEQKRAMDALLRLPLPPALGRGTEGEPRRSGAGMFFWKLAPQRMVGRKSEPAALAP